MPKKSTKKPKLNQLSQINAKIPTTELTSLDQVWGFSEISRYGTVDENEYKLKLLDMTRADLENHARATGCLVLEQSDRLRDELLKQFRSYILSLRKPASAPQSKIKVTPDVQKTLNEGR